MISNSEGETPMASGRESPGGGRVGDGGALRHRLYRAMQPKSEASFGLSP
jgi:hypothetical protein